MKNISFLLILIFSGCTSEHNEESLIKDILVNKADPIIDHFYKAHRLDKKALTKTITSYSDKLASRNDLRMEKFRDEINFKKRPRLGYNFINANNNIEYSITYKFTELNNGLKRINYIDFRSSKEDLPCLKFPSKFPIKCIDAPIEKPKSIDSLTSIFPILISNKKVYHEQLVSQEFLKSNNDSLYQILTFNLGNKKISDNIENIIGQFSKRINTDYTISSYSSFGEPTTYISYLQDHFDEDDLWEMKLILQDILGEDVKLNEIKKSYFKRRSKPRIIIGGIVSQAKVRVCGIPGLTTLKYNN